MLELLLIRHGETDSNKKGTYLGWTDVELNEEGIRQAYRLKESLKGIKVDGIFSSPLKRTRKTAEIINESLGVEIVYSDYLKERNFGIWDNLTFDEIKECYPAEHEQWMEDWVKYGVRDGESALVTYTRNVKFIDEIMATKYEGTYLVVTHLGTIRFMLAYVLGMELENSWRFKVDNCSVTKVEINDGYGVITRLNCSR